MNAELTVPARVSALRWLRNRLRSLPFVGKAFRYVKRRLFLAWNFQKLYESSAVSQHLLREQTQLLRELTAAMTRTGQLGRDLRDNQAAVTQRIDQAVQEHGGQLRAEVTEPLRALAAELQQQLRGEARQLRDENKREHQQEKYCHAEYYGALVEQATKQNGLLENQTENLGGLERWLNLLSRKVEMLALDVRERVPAIPERELPEPQIVDTTAFAHRLWTMGERVRVNLGCGERPLKDYINIDFRPMPQVDVVADARNLPFAPGTVAELASSHLVEHFREHQLRTVLLPYWKQLLRPDGAIRITCPDWGAMLRRLGEGTMDLALFKRITFGAQDYTGDDHFAMYTVETLTEVLSHGGFGRVDVVAQDRNNGGCPEMELLAHVEPPVLPARRASEGLEYHDCASSQRPLTTGARQ